MSRASESTSSGGDELQDRILDAALVLVSRWGVTKTALADVATEVGCSRATIYRQFPGGKQHLFASLAHREMASAAQAAIDAFLEGDDFTDSLTRAIVVSSRLLRDHDAARFVLAHEPELVLPYLGFGHIDKIFALARSTFGPTVAQRLAADRVDWAIEWAVRLFITSLPTNHKVDQSSFELTDPELTRSLIERFIAPAFNQNTITQSIPA